MTKLIRYRHVTICRLFLRLLILENWLTQHISHIEEPDSQARMRALEWDGIQNITHWTLDTKPISFAEVGKLGQRSSSEQLPN